MSKLNKKVLALILAAFLVIGSFADVLNVIDFNVFAAGEHNYVANNGDNAMSTVTVQTGGGDYIEIHALTDSLPYGRAFSLFPKAEDAHKYYAITDFTLKADWKIDKTQGIAFYSKLPEASVSTISATLRLNGTELYTANLSGAKVGYGAHSSDSVLWESLSAEKGVLSEKSGFEGFTFLPYQAFQKDGVALTAGEVNQSTSVQLMLAVASTSVSDYNKDWIFDELGFYENAESYIRGVKISYGTEYIANSGDNANEIVKLQWNCNDGQITFSQRDDALAPYGKAIGLKTGDLNSDWNNYKTGFIIKPEINWDISATTGYAFYCELPDVGADTAMDIWWYINDDICWNELQPGKPVYYVEHGSDKIEETTFSWDEYSLPGHDHGGFKGFIFVPFSSLKQKFNGKDRQYINEADYFELRVGIARRPDQEPDLAEQTFVFDEIGLYTEPLAYIDAAKAKSCIGEYEIIANDGSDAAATVKLPQNYDGVKVGQEDVGTSPYGASISIKTAASGWNANKTGIVLDSGDKSLSMSNGIAFYAKVPDVGSLDTALDVWLWNSDRYCWNELKPGSNVYYIEKGTTAVTAVEFQWSEYSLPLHGKSGWEGFVFIPFESFKCTWSDNKGKDLELLRERTHFELRFNVARTDAGLANQTFIFDELGFYRDPVSYVAAAEAHREDPKQSNIVANNGSNVSETVTVPNAIGGGRVVVSQQESGVTPYGEAMKMTLGAKEWNLEKVRVNMPVANDFDMSATKGFAFYVKAPAVDAATDPCIDILFYKNDSQYWNALENGKPIYYLENGSDTLTSELFSSEKYTYPLSKRAGFEGFVFIPFDSLRTKYNGSDRDYINEAKNLQLWFNPARAVETHPNLAGQTYIFDEFGFYSDELSYAAYCLKQDGADIKGLEYLSNTAVDSSKAHICGSADSVAVTQIDNAVKMGMAYAIYPSKEGANNVWTEFELPKANDWDLTRTQGIAFYAKIPANSGKGLQVMIYLDDEHYYNDPLAGKNFYYVTKGTDKVEKVTNGGSDYPFAGKSDWEGWFFLPYNTMQKNGSTATAASIASASKVSVRLSLISTNTADYNKNYIIDELGYFSDPLSYIKSVKSLYVDKSANYIANDGSNAGDTVIAQWDMTNQITIEQSNLGASPYGASISLTNASSGWNMYKTGFVLNVEEGWDLSATNGIAFYLQIPEADIDPALDFLLFINNNDYWYGNLSDAKIYYLKDGSDTLTEDYATSLIGHNMQGFSGFVFVPFDSFKGMSGKRGIVNKATRFEWRVNAAQADRALLGKTYVFDELGFYSDPVAYAEKAREVHGSYEYVANNGSDANSFYVSNGGENLLKVEQSSKGQPFNSAIVITPTADGFENTSAIVTLKRQPIFNIPMTNGIGFYANVPKGITASGIKLTITADDKSYSGTVSGKKLYYIEKNSTKVDSTDASVDILKDKAGFCGFVFVPFEAINGLDRNVIDNAAEWKLSFSFNADSKAIGKSYSIDEVGFYSDPAAFAKPIKDTNANYIAESFNTLSAVKATRVGTEVKRVSGRTPYGSAVSIIPTKVRSDNTWDHININKDAAWNLKNTEGIAMYVRMPGGISETQVTVMLYLDDSKFYPNNTGPVYYIPKNSDGSVVRVSSRQTLYDKVGFEGWVFIPYSSLTAHDGGKIDVNALQNRSNFQIRISHYRLNEDELNKDFIFDEIGFYSDELMYIDAVRNKYGITSEESDGNYIANHGDDVDLLTVFRDGNSFSSVDLDYRNSPYGSSIAVSDISTIAEWHSIKLGAVLNTENNSAAKNAEGIAFYASFPDSVADTYCTLELYADEYHSYALKSGSFEDETRYTADYVTVDMKGNRKSVKATNALEELQGFEGYIFIPYSSLRDTSDVTKTALDSIDYIANSRCEIRFTREFSEKDTYNRCYVIDELGFYKTEQAYIDLIKTFTDASGGNTSGNIIANTCSSTDDFDSEDDSALTINIVGEKTSTGMSAEVISRYANDTATSAMLKMSLDSFLIKNSKGVAFYMEAPQAVTLSFVLKINETLSYKATKSISAGHKGIVYIPFESFTSDVDKMASNLDLSYSIEARIIQTVSNSGVGQSYIYDSVGFYADENDYKTLTESSFDETNDSIGNYAYTLDRLGIKADSKLKTNKNSNSETAIEVLEITPLNSAEQKLSFEISRSKNELWQLSNGITFFADLSGGLAITSISFKVGEKSYTLNSGSFSILPLQDEYSTPIPAYSLSMLSSRTAFVFIPFDSLSPAVAPTELAPAESATLTLGVSGIGKTASVGGVGFYGGIRPFIRALRTEMGYGNYILNDGEKLSDWTVGDTGVYTVSVNGKSPSGHAVAVVPETAGEDHFITALLNTEDGCDKTLGLAFFFNTPSGRSSTEMGIRLQISETEYWEYMPYTPVYYAESIDSPITTDKKPAVMTGKSGTKSYAFIPFSSFRRVYTDKNNQVVTKGLKSNASELLKGIDELKLIINNKRSNNKDTHYEYVFDTVGLYSDIAGYLETAGQTATVQYVTSAGYASGKGDSDEARLHIINTLDAPTDVTVNGAAASPATANGDRAVALTPSGNFSATFKNDLFGAEEAKAADGVMLWLETPAGVSNPEITVTLTDKNGKKYIFSEGKYYFNSPEEADSTVPMSGKLSLPEFKGNVIIPFESFQNGKELSFIDIKEVTVSGKNNLKGNKVIISKAYAYPALDFLRMSLGDLAQRYSITSADKSSIVVSEDVIRVHKTSLTYNDIIETLNVSPAMYSLALPKGVNGKSVARGKVSFDVMRNSIKIGSINIEIITDDIVADTLIVITPEVPSVPDREVTVSNQVLVKEEVFPEETEKHVTELIRVKEAAAALVKLEGDTVFLTSVMSAERLMSAFTVADGVKLYIADEESCLINNKDGVYNKYYLVVEYEGVKTGFNIKAPNKPVEEEESFNALWIILAAAAVLLVLVILALIIIIKKKKQKKA